MRDGFPWIVPLLNLNQKKNKAISTFPANVYYGSIISTLPNNCLNGCCSIQLILELSEKKFIDSFNVVGKLYAVFVWTKKKRRRSLLVSKLQKKK